MKKIKIIFLLFVLSLFVFSCGKKEEIKTTEETKPVTEVQNQQNVPQVKVSLAEQTVKNWIQALGNQNFREAHSLMTSKKGGDYSKFSSTKGYGGITRTNLMNCSVDREDETSAEVTAEYESFDPVNRDGKFKQKFILIKEGDKWLISDIKNINLVFYDDNKVVDDKGINTEKNEIKETQTGYKGVKPTYHSVKNGYLRAFGDEVTIGEVFDVVSNFTAYWTADYLGPKEKLKNSHYLVEAKWKNEYGKLVTIQFLCNGNGKEFELHGASIGKEFVDPWSTILGFKEAWIQKGGTLK